MNAGTTRKMWRRIAGDGNRIGAAKIFAITVIKAAASSAIKYAGMVTPSTFPAHTCLRTGLFIDLSDNMCVSNDT